MSEPTRRWALILHGGAKEIKPGEEVDNRRGVAEALERGQDVLAGGGTALEAVEAAVRVLETRPVFNAGYGSTLNSRGEVEMDASLMDGATLDIGAVAALQGVRHPISVAHRLLREEPILLAGEGARSFAAETGAEMWAPEDLISPKQSREFAKDTVGCVALDVAGNLAVGTSTGGLSGSLVGRVGDSPLPGCGFYADNQIGAVGFSGHGEGIARLTLASQVIARIDALGPAAAVEAALSQMPRVGGDGGGIAIDRSGAMGWWHNSPHFAVALTASDMAEPQIWLHKDEVQR